MTDLAPSWMVPEQETAHAEPWIASLAGTGVMRPLASDDLLPEWDPARAISLRRRLLIRPAFWKQGGLGRDSEVMVCATWQMQGQPLGGSAEPVVVGCDRSRPLEIDQQMAIPAGECGGILSIRSLIVLRRRGRGADPLAASLTGQLLWMSEPERPAGVQVRLEGDGALFPVMGLDFGRDGLPVRAAWTLRWNEVVPDLHAQVSSSFRLLVNTAIPAVRQACAGQDGESRRLRSVIRADMARQILSRLLAEDGEVGRERTYAEGTLGRLLWSLLRATFGPDAEPRRIATYLRESPEEAWLAIQDAWGIGTVPAEAQP